MRPLRPRALYFWTAIVATLCVPGYLLTELVIADPFWVKFFCGGAWYGNWETALALLVPSVLHHQYWLGRNGGGQNQEALAVNLLVHGMILLPALILLMVGFRAPVLPGPSKEQFLAIYFCYLVFWAAMIVVVARLNCLWPSKNGQSRSMARRMGSVFALTAVTHVLAYFLLWGNGPCWVLSLP